MISAQAVADVANEFYIAAYGALALALGWLLFGFLKRSEVGVFIVFSEIYAYAGVCLYPLLFYTKLIAPDPIATSFLAQTGSPGIGAWFHTASYVAGAFSGLFLASRLVSERSLSAAVAFAGWLVPHPRYAFRYVLIGGVTVLLFYMAMIGWEASLKYAFHMRMGIYTGLSPLAMNFLFLKTWASLGLLAVCFLPVVFKAKSDWIYIGSYVVFCVVFYFVTISRMIIFFNLFVPLIFYFRLRFSYSRRFFLACLLVLPAILLVVFYGKTVGSLVYQWIREVPYDPVRAFLSDRGFVSGLFGNFSFMWFSIEAGLRHAQAHGLSVPPELLLSWLGIMPSRVMEALGLSGLDYRLITGTLGCLNTSYFNIANCAITPRDLGATAYMLPFAGAMLVGASKYFLLRGCEMLFMRAAASDYGRTWMPVLAVVLVSMIYSFVPALFAQLAFFTILFTVFWTIRKLSGRATLGPL